MFKPYLIYNGTSYLSLCTKDEYHIDDVSGELIFIDEIIDDIILDISCSLKAANFNSALENRYSIVTDIRMSNSEYYGVKDVFSIITQRTTDLVEIDEHEYLFPELNEYVIDYGDYFIFDMERFLDDIDMKGIFRLYLVLNLPSIIINKDDTVYDSIGTFFGKEWMYDFNYELGDGDYRIEFKTFYMHPQKMLVDQLIEEVESYNASSKHPIIIKTNSNNHPMIRNIGEIDVRMLFEKKMFKKQLFFVFRTLKLLLEEDVTIKIIA
jgi:hypothetical protein